MPKSGNDGRRVRERPLVIEGVVIAYRERGPMPINPHTLVNTIMALVLIGMIAWLDLGAPSMINRRAVIVVMIWSAALLSYSAFGLS